MKIGVIYDGRSANGHYRAGLPLRVLERRGHRVYWPTIPSNEIGLDLIPPCDVIYLQRCQQEVHLKLVAELRARGIATVWDTDDNLGEIPKIARNYFHLSRKTVKLNYRRTIEIARSVDLMTTTTPDLARIYQEAGVERVSVIHNGVSSDDIVRRRESRTRVVIGYAGAVEHIDDIEKLRLSETLGALLDAHPHVRVTTIGMRLPLRNGRYQSVETVPIGELVRNERDFDIGIAPLADTPMNRARSDVKLKEYAAAGAMWVASPVGPYRGLGEEQGGVLVDDRDWYGTLEALVTDADRRRALTERARVWVKTQTVERAATVWETAFKSAVQVARSR